MNNNQNTNSQNDLNNLNTFENNQNNEQNLASTTINSFNQENNTINQEINSINHPEENQPNNTNINNQISSNIQNMSNNNYSQYDNQFTNSSQSINMPNQSPSTIAPQNTSNPQLETINNRALNNNSNEIDSDFTEPKKGHTGLIIFLILVILLVCGIVFYYFIYDNPKTVIHKAIENYTANIKENIPVVTSNENYSIDFDLAFNIKTSDDQINTLLLTSIFNDMKLKGKIGKDVNKKQGLVDITITYKDEELINAASIVPTENPNSPEEVYIKLKDISDKVFKVETDLESGDSLEATDALEDYTNILSTMKNALTGMLDKATYKKSYTKLSDKYVKKISIDITEESYKEFYTILLNDKEFIKDYAKNIDMTEEEVTDELNKSMSQANTHNETINVYLGIINNEFIMTEIINDTTSLKITKENNQYNLSLVEDNTSKIECSFELNINNSLHTININFDDHEEEYGFDITLSYTYDTNSPELYDITNAVLVDEITEQEYQKIEKNLANNETMNSFIKDLEAALSVN